MQLQPGHSRQCVIWFGDPQRRERDALTAAGWQIRTAAGTESFGLRGEDTVVGLVDLRDEQMICLDSLERLASAHHYLSLIAILPPPDTRIAARQTAAITGRLVERCVEAFSDPPDLARMIQALELLVTGRHPTAARGLEALVGESPAMRDVHASIRKFAPVDLPVLITGRTGTGKEVAARALCNLSTRHGRPFVAINCGALPLNLVQSELFGHERGAFTGATARRAGLFETADGGTVFLDEVGELPLDAQANLLRVLQEGSLERVGSRQPVPVDVRVMAATNLDLEQAVATGRFRSDLFYRLNVLRLHMPTLSERGKDIHLLSQHFLDGFRRKHHTRARSFSPAARKAMLDFGWPGHVRELLNRVQRAAVSAEAELISPADLDLAAADGSSPATSTGDSRLESAREAAEHETLLACLRENDFNISQTARRLKISRVTVYRLCRKLGLDLEALRR